MTRSLRFLYFLVALTFTSTLFAQKKIINHSDKDLWNTIENRTISNDGNFVLYALKKGDRDQHLKIKSKNGTMIFEHKRSENGKFTYDSKFAVFTIKAWQDSILEMKRRKVKKDEMPKDTVGIYDLNSKALHKIAHVKSYKLPEKWSGYMAYQLEEIKEKKKEKDSTEKTKDSTNKKKKKAPKVGKDNGYHLVLRNLVTQKEDTFKYVTNYTFAEKSQRLAYTTAGIDSVLVSNVHVLNLETSENTKVYSADKAKYYQLNFSESGKQLAFVVDADTTKAQIRPYELYAVKDNQKAAQKIIDSTNIPTDYLVSSDGRISFSKDDSKLYFGLRREPIIKDTSLVDEEIVNVEVWTYDEPRLYTVQELQANNDRKKSFQAVYHLNKNKLVQLASEEYPNLRLADEGNAKHALLSNPEPYLLESQWTGRRANDYVVVNTETGKKIEALKGTIAFMNLSPKGEYAYGYDPADSTWLTYSIKDNKRVDLTKGKVFYNELNDSPRHPGSYGIAGWTKDDASILIYDRYDIWQFNPYTGESSRLTKGRETKTRYRYLRLDDEERFLDPDAQWILSTFDENNKHSGFYTYDAKRKSGKQLIAGPYTFSNLEKAQQSDEVVYSRESFEEFPDIRLSTLDFSAETVISNANPQQSEYNWGTAELVSWTSLDGKELQGMLIKPEDFDPNKKYPMIVNFYEKSSDGLYRHRAPSWGRSTINYSYYTSNGYVIFNPDVHYRIGYPGESAYNCVIPGVTSLIEKGYIDKDNIGVQGHSWGGYQIAYLVTKTDIFKAAESGAPVPNMISAYGGIRWWTGLSRQFQYEHTQSRIGGTPWEYPLRYIENSPIFYLDKVNTPLLIMHNDADGHVPWYQGIEFFVSLRRLGKPSWFLNYNDEPHWPLKLQNRKDFNIRMAQFFDYYLKGAPKPVWMERGVPAIEKGINQGLELIKDE